MKGELSTLRPKLAPSVVTREAAGERVIVQPASAELAILNEVAARIVLLVDGQRTVDDIVGAIVDEYAVTVERAGVDVATFLDDLAARGMIEWQ